MQFSRASLLGFAAVLLVLWGCSEAASPAADTAGTSSALTPFIGTWTYSSGSITTTLYSSTLTITSTGISQTISKTGTLNGTGDIRSNLAATVSSNSISADFVVQFTKVAVTQSVTTTNVLNDYGHMTLALSGNSLTVAGDSGNSTSIAASEATTVSGGVTYTKS